MTRILLTGAAGMLGKILRENLRGYCDILRVSDLREVAPAGVGEEVVKGDLGDFDAVKAMVENCDFIIHLGGMAVENTFDTILHANIRGTYNIYEAARQEGVPRILFASSNHTIGFHQRTTQLDAESLTRPDSIYGVSKCFGESLSRYYFDKYNIETGVVRIGSCFPKPKDKRMMATWMSFADFTDLVKCIFEADYIGYTIIYGVSANKQQWWDNHLSGFLGWHPKDSSEKFADDPHLINETSDPNDPAIIYQGGSFASAGHFEDDN